MSRPALSPLTRSRLFTTLLAQAEAEADPKKRAASVETRTVYLCPQCDDEHKTEDAAMYCCAPSIEEATRYVCPECDEDHETESAAMECCGCAGAPAPARCPVCNGEAQDYEDAADCCLWKDLDKLARRRIANAVEAGEHWSDAIAKEAA